MYFLNCRIYIPDYLQKRDTRMNNIMKLHNIITGDDDFKNIPDEMLYYFFLSWRQFHFHYTLMKRIHHMYKHYYYN